MRELLRNSFCSLCQWFSHLLPSTLISVGLWLFLLSGVLLVVEGAGSSGAPSFISFGLLMYHINKSESPLKAIPITNINMILNQ